MEDRATLLDIVSTQHPGLIIGAYTEDDSLVVCLYCEGSEARIALSNHPLVTNVDTILGAIANRLVCCRNCEADPSLICHQDHRIMANRMQRFFGVEVYEELLANAPLTAAPRELSPVR